MRCKPFALLLSLVQTKIVLSNLMQDGILSTSRVIPKNQDYYASFDVINGGSEKDTTEMYDPQVTHFIKELGPIYATNIDFGFSELGIPIDLEKVSKDLSELETGNLDLIEGELETKGELDSSVLPESELTKVQEPSVPQHGQQSNLDITGPEEYKQLDIVAPLNPIESVPNSRTDSPDAFDRPTSSQSGTPIMSDYRSFVEDISQTITADVIAAPRPSQLNRIATRTTTITHTMDATGNPTPDQTTVIEVTETYYPTSSRLGKLQTSTQESRTVVPLTASSFNIPPQVPTTSIAQSSIPKPLPYAPHPHAPSALLPGPAQHTAESLYDPTSEGQPFGGVLHIEETIKHLIEKYLTERLDDLLPKSSLESSSSAVLVVKPISSTQADDMSPTSAVPHTSHSAGSVKLAADSQNIEYTNSIINDIEGMLSDGFEDLNVDRLERVLKEILDTEKGLQSNDLHEKPTQDIENIFPLNPHPVLDSGSKTQDPELNQEHLLNTENELEKSGYSSGYRDTKKIKSYLKPSDTTNDSKSLNSLIEILSSINSFDKQGLSDKELKDLNNAQSQLEKLRGIPEDVLDYLFSEDKRHAMDSILHKPYLKKIGMDMTNVDNNANIGNKETDFADEDALEDFEFESINENVELIPKNVPQSSNNVLESFDEVQDFVDSSKQMRQEGDIGYKKPLRTSKLVDDDSLAEGFADENSSRLNLVFEKDTNVRPLPMSLDSPNRDDLSFQSSDRNPDNEDILKQHSDLQNAGNSKNYTNPATGKDSSRSKITHSSGNDKSNRGSSREKVFNPKEERTAQDHGNHIRNTDSFLERFKKNPSLLFTEEGTSQKGKHPQTENDMFDFTKSSGAVTHRYLTTAYCFIIFLSLLII